MSSVKGGAPNKETVQTLESRSEANPEELKADDDSSSNRAKSSDKSTAKFGSKNSSNKVAHSTTSSKR